MILEKELKVGDRIRGLESTAPVFFGTVHSISDHSAYIQRDDGKTGIGPGGTWKVDYCGGCWRANGNSGFLEKLAEVKTKKMSDKSITERFSLFLTKEPQKSFRKANITNGDDLLTEDGMKIFLSYLLHQKYADDFKKDVVDQILSDTKEDSK